MSYNTEKYLNFKTEYSQFQIDYFICVKSGKTPYGIFKQACLEMKVRHGALFEDLCDIEEKKEEVKLLTGIPEIRMQMQIKNMQISYKRKEREYKRFLEIAAYLDQQFKFTQMDEKELEQLEYDKWYHDLKDKMASQMLANNGRLDANYLQIVKDCPPILKEKLQKFAFTVEGREELQKLFLTETAYSLPEKLPTIKVKETKIIDFIDENL